ncbi:MAG: hypothetical protein WCZ23_02395 [Rhodospirillaceae bacterium]
MLTNHHTSRCITDALAPPPDPAFAEAGRRAAVMVARIGACTMAGGCPIDRPVRAEIQPAISAGQAEALWRATLTHAQTALNCRRDCPAVDMMRALLDATRRAYQAAG